MVLAGVLLWVWASRRHAHVPAVPVRS